MTKRIRAGRPGLSPARIVAAAAELVDREGGESLSARRLGAMLDCKAMSLYHHVASMGDLLDQVVDQALGSLALPEPDSRAPLDQLGAMTHAYLDLARTRPNLFRVVASHRWHTPAEVAFQGRMIELLIRSGMKPRAALRAARMVLVYLNGSGLAMAAWALDGSQSALGSASPAISRLKRLSNPKAVARDLAWGLDLLLNTVSRPVNRMRSIKR